MALVAVVRGDEGDVHDEHHDGDNEVRCLFTNVLAQATAHTQCPYHAACARRGRTPHNNAML